MKKSQSTQNKNPDLEGFQNSQMQMRKTRYFSLTTYVSEKQLTKAMRDHVKSIRAFCYILHDKDENVPHYHLLMRTHSTWTCVQVLKWFKGYVDGEGKPINTFCEVANDLVALEDYLTHSDEKSISEGKHLYSKEDIKDYGMWDLIPKNESYDDSLEIVNKILVGTPYRELVRQYGRKFLYHWEKFADMAGEIRNEEGFAESKTYARMELYGSPKLEKVEDMRGI